jgi:hypothetical protein
MVGQNRSRYLHAAVQADLPERMVLIGGPRQVGKTTLALSLLTPPDVSHPAYLSWDDLSDRRALLTGSLPPLQPVLVLDEVHKFGRWRTLLKGLFDKRRGHQAIVVTGSARLDYYRKGGDSLQGRYHFHRLHPFSLPEVTAGAGRKGGREALATLLRFGGFPEPFLRSQERFWRRWQRERVQRVVYGDVRDLEQVREVSLIELLVADLPHRVGAPLSVKGLSLELSVAFETVERWLQILERLYLCYRVPPLAGRRIRAVRKEKKLYLWDWSLVPDAGPRFENMLAGHLLKYCHFLEDTEGWAMELCYLRDTDRREVDFVVLRDRAPLFAVECKTGERHVGPAVRYFKERLPIPRWYQVHLGERDYESGGVRVLPFHALCAELGLV